MTSAGAQTSNPAKNHTVLLWGAPIVTLTVETLGIYWMRSRSVAYQFDMEWAIFATSLLIGTAMVFGGVNRKLGDRVVWAFLYLFIMSIFLAVYLRVYVWFVIGDAL